MNTDGLRLLASPLAGAGRDSRHPPGPAIPHPHPHTPPQRHTCTCVRAGGPAPHSPLVGVYQVFVMPLELRQLGHMHPTEIQADLPFILAKKIFIDKFWDTGQAQHTGHTGPTHVLQSPWGTFHHN